MLTFKEAKVNDPVYILDKDSLSYLTCNILAIKPGKLNSQNPGSMYMDVTLEINGVQNIYSIPDNLSITYTGTKGQIVMSLERSLLTSDLESCISERERIINSIDLYKTQIETAKKLLIEVNPVFKEKQETEARFSKLEADMSEIKQLLEKLVQ